MNGGKVLMVVIVTLLVGIGVGYFVWGAHARTQAAALADVQAKLATARRGTAEGALATKIQEAETRIKNMTEELTKETALREKLEKLAAGKKKP
jgi:Flp pilus assembly protein TadB